LISGKAEGSLAKGWLNRYPLIWVLGSKSGGLERTVTYDLIGCTGYRSDDPDTLFGSTGARAAVVHRRGTPHGGASPALAKTVHRGPILAGTQPKRIRGTPRALLGTQRGQPETVRDPRRRGAARVAGEQRSQGSGSGLSQAWHSAASTQPHDSTEGLSTAQGTGGGGRWKGSYPRR
jgi:hypothetical protein